MESENTPQIICQDLIYRPGSVLSGHVALEAPEKGLSNVILEAALVGVVLTSVLSKNYVGTECDGTARLVCAHAQLLPTEDGRFPFSFTFPEYAQDLPHDRVIFSGWGKESPFLSSQLQHQLPPSLEVVRDRYNGHVTAVVRYELVVKIDSPYHKNTTLRKRLRFGMKTVSPLEMSREVATDSSHFTVRGWELLPESKRPRGLSKLKTVVPPRLQVDTFVLFPIHIYLEKAIELYIQLTPTTSDEILTQYPPDVVLHTLSITIQAETHARSNKRFGEHKNATPLKAPIFEYHRHKDNENPASRPDSQPFCQANEHTRRILLGSISESDAVPTFSTYNVARMYNAKVRVVLCCGKEKFSVDRDIAVTVHPPLTDTGDSTHSDLDPELEPEPGEQLPSYEFAAAQSSTNDTKVYDKPGFNVLKTVTVSPNAISTNEQFLPQEVMESFFASAGEDGVPTPGPPHMPGARDYFYQPRFAEPSIRVPGGVDGQGTQEDRPSMRAREYQMRMNIMNPGPENQVPGGTDGQGTFGMRGTQPRNPQHTILRVPGGVDGRGNQGMRSGQGSNLSRPHHNSLPIRVPGGVDGQGSQGSKYVSEKGKKK